MNNNSDAEPEVMIHRAVKTVRVVIELNGANADSVGCSYVETAADCSGKTGTGIVAESRAAVYAGLIAKRAIEKRAFNFGFAVSHASHRMTERAETRAAS